MKFDWYQASIPDVNPAVVMAEIAKLDYYGEWVETRPTKGYDIAAQFVIGNDVLYRINHGGMNAEHGANVLGSGSSAPKLAQVVRDSFPFHRVSRVDSCEDFYHPDVYEYLRKKALRIAKEMKVQCREIVKPLADSDDGRTLYLGSQSSTVSMRIYEKGKQLGCGSDWVRAELQVRPQKIVKTYAAGMSPLEVWGLAKWSHAMAVQMGNSDLQRADVQIFQKSDQDRAYRFMLKQYGNTLRSMLASHGSWDTVGAQIGYDLDHIHDESEKPLITRLKNP